MIDLGLLREDLAHVIALLKKKDPAYDAQRLVDLDKQVRDIRLVVENIRHKKNELAKQGRGGITQELREQSIAVSKELKAKEHELEQQEEMFLNHFLAAPNLPDKSLQSGGPEANVVVREVGNKPSFDFSPQNHLDLGEKLGWFDFEAASRIAGANFALYKGDAVKLMYALCMFMLKNNLKHGYQLYLPSVLVNEQSLTVTGNFPKFKDQVFTIKHDELFLTPTAEVNLANIYRDQILMRKDLPVRMTAWTSSFRREGGAYGVAERGLIRMRQFEKVELYTICEPENSEEELDRMLACAEDILTQLNLHYRVTLLSTQECSFASAKTYDIEAWLPGQGEYYEVSSVSNCTDFQARRGLIRYKDKPMGKTRLTHTLNGSSLALSRLMVAIMETYQQADGTIVIPDVLRNEALFT